VDVFTDQHEAFRRSKSRIEGPARRFASVLVDVFYDHFLAQRFAELAQGEDLTTFASASYAMLQERRESLRGALAVHLDRMIQNRWLEQAQSIDGVGVVLRRIALRSRRATHLEHGVEELMRNYDGLRMDFAEFWPEVSRFADEHAATCAARL
jgi:acyl carrier protein phosphodiesterase